MSVKLTKEIIWPKSTILLMIYGSTTLSNKCTLVVYVLTCVLESGINLPVNSFLDVVEFKNVIARGIFDSIHKWLQPYAITEDCLKSNLVCVVCASAAIMLECI